MCKFFSNYIMILFSFSVFRILFVTLIVNFYSIECVILKKSLMFLLEDRFCLAGKLIDTEKIEQNWSHNKNV